MTDEPKGLAQTIYEAAHDAADASWEDMVALGDDALYQRYSKAVTEWVSEYLRSDEAERALTNSMSEHVRGHQRSNSPHYFGCDGRCASMAALNAVERALRERAKP